MDIRALTAGDEVALEAFLRRIPEGDRTFFKEDVRGPEVVREWVRDGECRWLATLEGDVVGYVAIAALHGWSSHVGEIRLIVDPAHRGHGVGSALARHAVLAAFRAGLSKLVVEVLATQEYTIAMFRALGFDPEALLGGHVRDRQGNLRDLLILAHTAGEGSRALTATGLASGPI
jgi:ribosomal protein S18 acetylase RimI-like enzyme